jgi:hypothetical protein
VVRILENPAYTGAYVYGRWEYLAEQRSPKTGKAHVRLRPRDQWPVLIQEHHPAYVSWQEFLLRHAKVIFELEAKPEFGRGPEVPRQSERRVSRDPAPAAHDLVEPRSGDSQGLGEPVHAHAEWLQDVFQDSFSRVWRRYQFWHAVFSLVSSGSR